MLLCLELIKMEAKEGLELIKQVIDETVAQLGADPLIKISAQLAATKMLKISFKAGIKEAVGWLENHRSFLSLMSHMGKEEWEDQKKIWFRGSTSGN